MKISEVYQKFSISPNLQEHMLTVASLIEYLHLHWNGAVQPNWDLAVSIGLFHDLGNIVKFDFDKHPEFLGHEQANADYWRKQQQLVIEKYGRDDDEVTKLMLGELGLDGQMIEIIFAKRFGNSVEVEKSSNWVLKILYYADLRTLPNGIGTLEERLDDVRQRMPKYTSRPDFEDLISACRNIGKQIESNLDIPASQINKGTVLTNSKLLEIEV